MFREKWKIFIRGSLDMKISNLLNCFFYFWKLILLSDDLYSIILTNILDIFDHECWKVMIVYENQSQIESIISDNLTFICWCLISLLEYVYEQYARICACPVC